MSDENRDVVLFLNEYVHILDRTTGIVRTAVGPLAFSLGTNEVAVDMNSNTNRFSIKTMTELVIKPFVLADEHSYVVLFNPAKNNTHPESGMINQVPDLNNGERVVIPGPCRFALYAGQKAQVLCHEMTASQYLITKCYKDIQGIQGHKAGELGIVKGSDVAFYIPPTGIEVVQDEWSGNYVQDAVILKPLKYCILKDMDGCVELVKGPAVVFPRPDQFFMANKDNYGSYVFDAIELSETSGVLVKVIQDYEDDPEIDHYEEREEKDNKTGKITVASVPIFREAVKHKAGDTMFITGKDQTIYFPRPEHEIVDRCQGMNIPEGEGCYVMDLRTGKVRTVMGPSVYLPDPRYEKIVTRQLTQAQCESWYPGNATVLIRNGCGQSYSFVPYQGVVKIEVWPRYAVCVANGAGEHTIEIGPKTLFLAYDETLVPINGSVYMSLDSTMEQKDILVTTSDGIRFLYDIRLSIEYLEPRKEDWLVVNFVLDDIIADIAESVSTMTADEFVTNYSGVIRDTVDRYNECDLCVMIMSFMITSFRPVDHSMGQSLIDRDKKRYEASMAVDIAKLKQRAIEAEHEAEKVKLEVQKERLLMEAELQKIRLQAEKEKQLQELSLRKEEDKLEMDKLKAETDAQKKVVESIGPDLVAALVTASKHEMLREVTENLSPYSLASCKESVADIINKIFRGTSLEGLIDETSNS